MPTVFTIKGYRFFFFSNENQEPMHIHIEKAEGYAKFWIEPLALAANFGFNARQLREIGDYVEDNKELIKKKWNEHFSQ
mgnify:CR=1 FL=1